MSEQPSGRTGSGSKREFHHPDEVLAFVEGIRESNRRAIGRYEQYVEQVGDLTGEGFSSNGTVRAEVDNDGIVAALDIPDTALRRGRYLAEMILTAIREAQAARALKLAELGSALGAGRTLEMVRQAIPEHVRDAVEQHRERHR
ncbi:YbaB/EbfC family nucleoid-associated protein [Micromonospora arborensis]|uniref:YbaB/EbfC family nucleoid-associated protein n=1 Tax=Micromonospora arborensis TaxID=2116518 RepID=UPI003405B545